MKIVCSHERRFRTVLQQVRNRGVQSNSQVEKAVKGILQSVARHGDAAVARYSLKFDKVRLRPSAFRVHPDIVKEAHARIRKDEGDALRFAAERIRAFHERQRIATWMYQERGARLGQLVTPLETVGIYVPGGKAVYPSSVLMNAIPAKVAGVKRVVMCTPTSTGDINPYLLVAADIAGVDEVYRVGGAQAIAAMAYGTQTIPGVDKIVGPGNRYVATAKRLVYGVVDIDMIAGPSELVVIADESGSPSHVAADLLCEAEHDEEARVYLVTTSSELAQLVVQEIAKQLERLTRQKIAKKSIGRYAVAFVVPTLEEAFEVANHIAPEHLEIMLERALDYIGHVRHAGAVFLGRYTPPAVADYVAGPNHVLPTGGTARFSSCLSFDDFVKKSNVVCYTKDELRTVRTQVKQLSQIEGLDAHGYSMESRWD
ncbi:MAG: histidinol dehydrogenase [Nitrospirae bacterium]|nr:MAG: histidinol dehydrogenase [Nitrospirota bacterium]